MLFKKVLVTGGAGCIGSSLVERLLNDGAEVTIIDNLSSGKLEHLESVIKNPKLNFIENDIKACSIEDIVSGKDVVFHLSANPDIKYKNGDETDKDLKENTVATHRVLDAMRIAGVKKIVFASSSAVYGEISDYTPENAALKPISLYGASKAACEHMISAYCSMFGFQAWVFRFANVVGGKSRQTGTTVLTDFINRLKSEPNELLILGNGLQRKSYMTNNDCVDGMLFGLEKSGEAFNIFNLGPDDWIEVNKIASVVSEEIGVHPKLKYTGGDRGWPGDAPISMLNTNKMKALGWKPRHTSEEAVRIAVRALLNK